MQSKTLLITLLIAAGILNGCGDSTNDALSATDDNLSVRLQLPDSPHGWYSE